MYNVRFIHLATRLRVKSEFIELLRLPYYNRHYAISYNTSHGTELNKIIECLGLEWNKTKQTNKQLAPNSNQVICGRNSQVIVKIDKMN